jgi:hypothetical protein
MGNETAANNRVDALRQDLQMEFKKLTPQKGDLIVVRSQNPNYILSPQYIQFLLETLSKISNGANVLVAADHVAAISNIKPPEEDSLITYSKNKYDEWYNGPETETINQLLSRVYIEGWQTAINTILSTLENAG